MRLLVIYYVFFLIATRDNYLVLGDLESLGDEIAASVQASLAPLHNLGSRINTEVEKNLKPVRANLANLAGLDDSISQQVYNGLEPVRAIELNLKMREGVGGVTIVTYQPGGKQFVVKNHRTYTCDAGSIDLSSGTCSGTLKPFEITSSNLKSDWCYVSSHSLVNNEICLSTGIASLHIINNNIYNCRSGDRSPVLQLSLDDYKQLCSSISRSANYRYIPDLNDQNHVAIPNQNKYVKCDNQQENVCIFHENNWLLKANTRSEMIFINSDF